MSVFFGRVDIGRCSPKNLGNTAGI